MVVRRAPLDRRTACRSACAALTRSERCAAHVAGDRVIRKVTPEDIARRVAGTSGWSASPTLPCLRALARLASALDESSLAWGVTGSVGFTLASGFDVLRDDSDLDLLRARAGRGDAATLARAASADRSDAESRVDVQVETPRGAFALKEWLRTGGPVLLKTAERPAALRRSLARGRPRPQAAGQALTA